MAVGADNITYPLELAGWSQAAGENGSPRSPDLVGSTRA